MDSDTQASTQPSTTETNQLASDKEFFKNVKQWLDCNSKLKELGDEMKDIKDAKKKAEMVIIEKMTAAKEDTVAFQKGGNLRRAVSETSKPVKKEDITLAIAKLTNDAAAAEKITESIYSNRPGTQKVYLKHNKGRKKDDA